MCCAESASNCDWRDNVDDTCNHWSYLPGIPSPQRQLQRFKTQAAITEPQSISKSVTLRSELVCNKLFDS